ncbi:methyltransferase, partial [Mycobacterium sp. ITM-2017-0098]
MTAGPLQSGVVVDAVAADLRSAGYTTDGVGELLGADAGAAFSRGLWWSALRATDRAAPAQQRLAVLVRLFLLGADEPRDRAESALPTAGIDALVDNGVVEPTPAGG